MCARESCALAVAEQVPFGPAALMPGRLVHTNEVTMLLGASYYAETSASQVRSTAHARAPPSPAAAAA